MHGGALMPLPALVSEKKKQRGKSLVIVLGRLRTATIHAIFTIDIA